MNCAHILWVWTHKRTKNNNNNNTVQPGRKKEGEKKRTHDGISIPGGELKERRGSHTQESPFTVGRSAGTEKELQGIRQECSNWSMKGRTE